MKNTAQLSIQARHIYIATTSMKSYGLIKHVRDWGAQTITIKRWHLLHRVTGAIAGHSLSLGTSIYSFLLWPQTPQGRQSRKRYHDKVVALLYLNKAWSSLLSESQKSPPNDLRSTLFTTAISLNDCDWVGYHRWIFREVPKSSSGKIKEPIYKTGCCGGFIADFMSNIQN